MEAEKTDEALNRYFPVLTDENRKKIIDMTQFLVLTQNAIIPAMLKPHQKPSETGDFDLTQAYMQEAGGMCTLGGY